MIYTKGTVRRAKLIVLASGLLLAVVGLFGLFPDYEKASGFSNGPPASVSGAPGEGNCTGCHSDFAVNSGPGDVEISGVPAQYVPDQDYQLTVSVTEDNIVTFGFQITAIDSTGSEAGTFSLPVQNPAEMQIVSGMVGGQMRKYVEQTNFGTGGSGTRLWTFTWTAPNSDIGDVAFYAAGNAANSDGTPGGDQIYVTSETSNSPSSNPSPTRFDLDGDSRTDIGIFRPAPGEWWYLRSSNGIANAFQFGQTTDTIVPADFTGDGATDVAFWRDGQWFVLRSEDSSFFAFPFGTTGDIPVPGDFDGDGTADPAVFRPANATWYYIRSSDGGSPAIQFGLDGDIPIVEDYDGDGMDDLAVYRPSVSEWFLQRSTLGFIGFSFGAPGNATPAPADYTGDGAADIAFFNPNAAPGTNNWFVLRSEDSSFFAFPFGIGTDIPVPGDYDGDGIADPAVFRPGNNSWFLQQTTDGFEQVQFGIQDDIPIPSAYIP